MLSSVFSDNISAFGVLLAGMASVTTALLGARASKKRAKDECDQRLEDIKEAFRAGVRYEPRGMKKAS